MRPTTLAVALALLAAAAPSAGAQFAAVPAPPPRAIRANEPVPGDSASQATARDTVKEAQRLDVQAWVDSAAGALARTPPASTTDPRGATPREAPRSGAPTAPAPAPAREPTSAPRDSVARPRPPR